LAELLGGEVTALAEVAVEDENGQGIRRPLGRSDGRSIGCCFVVVADGASTSAAFVHLIRDAKPMSYTVEGHCHRASGQKKGGKIVCGK
jgi:hypothetical protein